MNKPILVFQAPIATRSGYGDHSRDILKSLFELDKYDVKVVPTRWGNTPQDQINPQTEFGQRILNSIVTQLKQKPDIFIQVSVANEFKKMGNYNIGITAGIETTAVPPAWLEGLNKMDLKGYKDSEFFTGISAKTGKNLSILKSLIVSSFLVPNNTEFVDNQLLLILFRNSTWRARSADRQICY